MKYRSMTVPYLTIGLDLGDKYHHLFALRYDGKVVANVDPQEETAASLTPRPPSWSVPILAARGARGKVA